MKIPAPPPNTDGLMKALLASNEGPSRIGQILTAGIGPVQEGKYRHWDILRHLAPPDGVSHEDWWLGIKMARTLLYRTVPLRDKAGQQFRYATVDVLMQMLHLVDKNASGAIMGSDLVTNPQTRDTYLFKTLVEESITSSQLEGASTTREVAKDMLQTGRPPRDRGERMILNNYEAMQFIRSVRGERLTPAILLELHRILTHETLENSEAAGRLRRADEPIVIEDDIGKTLYTPPPADELSERIDRLCAFANDTDGQQFLHPVVRSTLLHFCLAYDHPFIDGNGRTARALFYWSMAHHGYWLCEFISISRILKRAPARYSRAYLYTETDDGDTTYFLLNQLKVVLQAINELHEFLDRKARQIRETDEYIRQSKAVHGILNYRQLALLNHAMKHPGYSYSIDSHRRSHNVSYETARKDLMELAHQRLLLQNKVGRMFVYIAPSELRAQLAKVNPIAVETRPATSLD